MPMPRLPVHPDRHYVRWDDPSSRSKKSQRAVCGKFVALRDVALQQKNVTCPECSRWLDEFDSLKVE
jgi:hypothetical protein